jgi:hypothetical protein
MKKHILGFAVFNLIVIAFGLIYAFLYAPAIPRREEVIQPVLQAKKPVVEYDYRSSCHKNKPKQLDAEIISSNYYLGEKKIVSKIRVSLNGAAAAPDNVYVTANYLVSGEAERHSFGDLQIIARPFAEGTDEQILTIVSRVPADAEISPKANLYVKFNVTDKENSGSYNTLEFTSPESREVLFIHGKRR